MRSFSQCVFLIFIVLLTGCASSSPYGPIGGSEVGYAERRIKENVYEVTFQGHKRMSFESTYDFAVLRALEIGKTLGYEYMLLTSNKDKTKTKYLTLGGGCTTTAISKETTCSKPTTYRRTLPAYTVKVQYFEKKPKGRFLPENLFLIRASYLAMRHEYGMDK